ncbi:MAG: hypothetical protein EPN59_04125 [Paraburkholderia sp.]|nr:MAG: hypothetical protein EPN59_04125 [Paraburkholderia sp.]
MGNVLTLTPPLTVTPGQMLEALAVIEEAMVAGTSADGGKRQKTAESRTCAREAAWEGSVASRGITASAWYMIAS